MSYAGGSFWATVEQLVALDASGQRHPFVNKVEDCLENVSSEANIPMKQKTKKAHINNVDYGNLIDCSFCYPPVRSRLEMLMGTNIVRLTDRKYMLKLMMKIRQDHENRQQARVQDRKMQEVIRTKKLILNRFISLQDAPLEIHQYPLFQLYLYCDSINEQRCRKRAPRKVKISRSLYQLLYPLPDDIAESEEEEEDIPMKEIVVDGVPQFIPLTPQEIEERAKEKDMEQDIANGYMFTKEEFDNLHYEADSIKKLKEIGTVNDLYTKAHEIVGALVSLSRNEKRRRCARDEEIAAAEKAKAEAGEAASVGKSVKSTKSVKSLKSGKSGKSLKSGAK